MIGNKLYLHLKEKLKIMASEVLTILSNILKIGYRSNVFSPLVWLFAVFIIPAVLIILSSNDKFLVYIFAIAMLVILLLIVAIYILILNKNPLLLQTESFRIEDKKLDLIAQKGEPIQINPVDLTTPPKLLENDGEEAE